MHLPKVFAIYLLIITLNFVNIRTAHMFSHNVSKKFSYASLYFMLLFFISNISKEKLLGDSHSHYFFAIKLTTSVGVI